MTRLVVELPDVSGLPQDEEWCKVQVGDETPRTIRFHEYGTIFSIPGLYEELFYRRLRCGSPATLAQLLDGVLRKADVPPARLRGLDVGAGNGMVGEQLRQLGVSALIGADILPEAAAATRRDRPDVYQDYVVGDLTALSPADEARITSFRPNLLTTVAALGFGDMPSLAFARAWNLVENPAWIVFNIKQEFLDARHQHGFALLHRRLRDEGLLDVRAEHAYEHRLALDGRPLHYVGFVGMKTGPIPEAWLASLRDTPEE